VSRQEIWDDRDVIVQEHKEISARRLRTSVARRGSFPPI
jgi:hypothetical protein